MTAPHILTTGFIIAAGIVALIVIARDIRRDWRAFLDTLEDQ